MESSGSKRSQKSSPSWRTLLYEFTQETTLHGLRYTTLYSRYNLRRFIWAVLVIAAIGTFIGINIQNLLMLLNYPKSVNVEINYEAPMTFPAVTICNYNKHRLTGVSEMGLYDTIWGYYSTEPAISSRDIFSYLEGLCIYSQEEKQRLIRGRPVTYVYEYISQVACEKLCSKLHPAECSGIFYNRTSKQCEVTSAVLSVNANRAAPCTLGSLEYHRRILQVGPIDMTCSFETDQNCYMYSLGLERGSDFEDYWMPSLASLHEPVADNTLQTDNGHYLQMRRSTQQQDTIARFQSSRIFTVNSCIAFYYHIQGQLSNITLRVYSEELAEVVHAVAFPPPTYGAVWQRFFKCLPDGVHLVVIDGTRSSEHMTSLALDDVTIWPKEARHLLTVGDDDDPSRIAIRSGKVTPCGVMNLVNYGPVGECRRSSSGIDYMGVQSKTESGVQCASWKTHTLRVYHSQNLSIGQLYDERTDNVCRNPLGVAEQPFCLTYAYPFIGYCDIPPCECEDGYIQCATDGRCIPDVVVCNGINDCGDYTDEGSQFCLAHQSVSCTFDDTYICGYQSEGALSWSRVQGHSVTDGVGPTRDSHGRVSGFFMYVATSLGFEGDIVRLVSPTYNFTDSHCLNFSLSQKVSAYGMDKFRVLVNSPMELHNGITDGVIFYENRADTMGWTRITIHMQSSVLAQIVFEYTKGTPFQSAVAIDDISLTRCNEEYEYPKENTNAGGDFCNYESDALCEYKTRSDQAFAIWGTVPNMFVLEAGFELPFTPSAPRGYQTCRDTFIHSEGYIHHPSFPASYSSGLDVCVAHIIGPPGSDITLRMIYFDVEESDNCTKDVLIVYDGRQINSSVHFELYGSNQTGRSFNSLGSEVFVVFKSDRSIIGGGFRLHYEISTVQSFDSVLAMGYCGPESDSIYTAALSKATGNLNGLVCLSFSFWMAASTSLEVILSDGNRAMEGERLIKLESKIHMELSWNQILQQVEVFPNQHIRFVVNFAGRYSSPIMALHNLTLHAGHCPDPTVVRNIECNFSTDGPADCGMADSTPTKPGWLRRTVGGVGGAGNPPSVALVAVFYRSMAQMSSVTVPVTLSKVGDQCMDILTSVKAGEMVRMTAKLTFSGPFMDYQDYFEIDGFESGFLGPKFDHDISSLIVVRIMLPEVEDQALLYLTIQGHFIEDFAIHTMAFSTRCHEDVLGDANYTLTLYAFDMVQAPGGPSAPTTPFDPSEMGDSGDMNSFQQLFQTDIILQPALIADNQSQGIIQVPIIFTPVADMYGSTAHLAEDFIYRCNFNGQPCSNASIVTKATDFGMCYTFNSGEMESPLLTDKPGARHGLSLTLNVEQYEHMPGTSIDAGTKIFAHTQGDIPAVRDLGSATSLSSHTLVSVHRLESISLGHPYGDCGGESLPLFPMEAYTFTRCTQQCETESLLGFCGCKNFYMPGEFPYCTVKDQLECIIPTWETNFSSFRCSCNDACRSTIYGVEQSATTLSELGIDRLLDNDTSHLKERVSSALNTKQRFDPEQLYNLMNLLSGAGSAVGDFLTVVDAVTNPGQNSPYYLVQKSILDFALLARNDIELLMRNLSDFQAEYHRHYGNKVEAVITRNTLAVRKLTFFLELLTIADGNRLNQVKTTLADVVNDVDLLEQSLQIDPFHSWDHSHKEYLPQNVYLPSDQPEDACHLLHFLLTSNDLVEMMASFKNTTSLMFNSSSLVELRSYVNYTYFDIFLTELRQFIQLYGECYQQYPTLLNEISDWNVTANLNSAQDVLHGPSFELEIEMLLDAVDLFEKHLYQNFVQNKMRMEDFSGLILNSGESALSSNIHATVDKIYTELDAPLRQLIETMRAAVYDAYLGIFDYFLQLQQYMGQAVDFTEDARRMKIWLKPFSQAFEQSTIAFHYTADELGVVWSPNHGMAAFIESRGRDVIAEVNGDFFKDMQRHLDENKETISNIVQKSETSFVAMEQLFQNFQKATTIDADFLMNNFQVVDVYFGELRSELTEQSPYYQWTNFFSDMGGYMGLLLGASVMTVCELLDLLIYNCARKRNENKGVQIHAEKNGAQTAAPVPQHITKC